MESDPRVEIADLLGWVNDLISKECEGLVRVSFGERVMVDVFAADGDFAHDDGPVEVSDWYGNGTQREIAQERYGVTWVRYETRRPTEQTTTEET